MFDFRTSQNLSLEEKVQLLMDEREIRDVIYRDCRGKSRCDIDLIRSCFFDDAIDHHQPFWEGPVGPAFDRMEQSLSALGQMVEYIAMQVLIQIDGDLARAESFVLSVKTFHERTENGNQVVRQSGMRNLDRLERRNGEWRIAERWFVPEWGCFQEVPPLAKPISIYGEGTEANRIVTATGLQQIPSTRNRDDLSYRF